MQHEEKGQTIYSVHTTKKMHTQGKWAIWTATTIESGVSVG